MTRSRSPLAEVHFANAFRAPTFRATALLLVTGLVPFAARAQVYTRTLATPDKTFEETFSSIVGFRELADGRVIVGDTREKTLRVLDPRTGVAAPIGREGGGPVEWGMISRLYKLPGDSTLMSDFANARYFLIGPDAKPVTTFRLPDGVIARGQLFGVDQRGRLLFESERLPANPGFRTPSTGIVDILRFDRATQRVDTLGQFERAKGEQSGAKVLGGGMLQRYTNLPLAAIDVAAVSFDGRIALVRGTGYRVDWISAEGKLTRGAPTSAATIRITQAEKDAFIKGLLVPGQIVTSGGPITSGGGASGARARPTGGAVAITSGAALDDVEMTWPANKPPFLSGAAQVAPDGRVWVLRTRAHDDPIPTFDVFDAAGKLVERVVIPKSTRLVGFGKDVVYLARTDEDDLLQLERHPLK